MPLSEHEQRLLEQMERALYAEDPKLASTLGGAGMRRAQRRAAVLGLLGLLLGLGLLFAGVILPSVPLGVLGFAVMLGATWFAIGRPRQATTARPSSAPAAGKQSKSPSGVMNRFEERWRRRRDSQQ